MNDIQFSRLTLFLTGWVLVLLLGSCKLNEVNDPAIVIDIDDEFYVELWEELTPTLSSLQLKTSTIQEEECLNYVIDYQVSNRDSKIRVSIDDIIEPDDCLTGTASAVATIEVGQLNNTTYPIEINLKNSTIVNVGQLQVTADRYTIEMNTTNGIALVREQLMRVPATTVWGYLSAENLASIMASFRNDLNDNINDLTFATGDYGYFEVEDDGEVIFSTAPKFSKSEQFIIGYSGSVDALKTLVTNYRDRYGAELEMKVFTWQGEEL